MARDAIARQYDVDKHSVQMIREPLQGSYQPGIITFQAKKGRSIDLERLRESIAATRLSGGTKMSVDWLEITARGTVSLRGDDLILKVSSNGSELVLGEDAGAKGTLQRLREAARGSAVVTLTGRVQGWNGRMPDVVKALDPNAPGGPKPTLFLVKTIENGAK